MTAQEKQARLERYLRDHHLPYSVLDGLEPSAALNTEEATSGLSGSVVQVILVSADGRPIMAVLPDTAQLDAKKTAAAVGARVACIAQNRHFSGIFGDSESKAMLPLGIIYGLPLYVDASLIWSEYIIFRVGWSAQYIRVPYREFVRLARPVAADLTAISV